MAPIVFRQIDPFFATKESQVHLITVVSPRGKFEVAPPFVLVPATLSGDDSWRDPHYSPVTGDHGQGVRVDVITGVITEVREEENC